MGSFLAPVLANFIFSGYHENKQHEQYRNSEVLFHQRKADDTFRLLNSE